MKVRSLSFLLALILLCTPLCACDPSVPDPNDTTPDAAITTAPDPEDTPENTDVPTAAMPITPDNASGLVIVCPQDASTAIKNSLKQLAHALATKFGTAEPSIVEGTEASREGTTEIVVGAEFEGFYPLREKDFAMGYEKEDVYISAGGTESLYLAINQFGDIVQNELTLSLLEPTYTFGDYPIRSATINGVHISEYTVVVPSAGSALYENYAAEIFCEYVKENTGFELQSVTDKTEETKYEILIGDTARTANANVALADGQYAVFSSGDKIVCRGKNHMVAAGLSLLVENMPADGKEHKLILSENSAARTFEYKEARNAILMIGDGMGFNSIEMAKFNRAIEKFCAYDLPVLGQSKTNNVYNSTTDSAAGATALSTGYKTVNGYLGVDKNGTAIMNVRELADVMGAKTAVLTTDSITGATPSGFLAHHTSRNDTAILQNQINTIISDKKIEFCEGSIGDNLTIRFKAALKAVTEDGSDFFVMLEEAYIDKHSHNNYLVGTCTSVRRFNFAIAYAMIFTVYNPDTVLIITADHETGGIKRDDSTGKYVYTSTGHTSANVPIFACGAGTEIFNDKAVENTSIAKMIAGVFGAKDFGK